MRQERGLVMKDGDLVIGLRKQPDSEGFKYLASYLMVLRDIGGQLQPCRVSRLDRDFGARESLKAAQHWKAQSSELIPVVCLLDV
jgi:hypothetical protein